MCFLNLLIVSLLKCSIAIDERLASLHQWNCFGELSQICYLKDLISTYINDYLEEKWPKFARSRKIYTYANCRISIIGSSSSQKYIGKKNLHPNLAKSSCGWWLLCHITKLTQKNTGLFCHWFFFLWQVFLC